MSARPKPIEGHILDRGIDPGRLSDADRAAIAECVIKALLFGDGWLQRLSDGTFRAAVDVRRHHQRTAGWGVDCRETPPMSDELVRKLRVIVPSRGRRLHYETLCAEAADRIEALEAENRTLREALNDHPIVHLERVDPFVPLDPSAKSYLAPVPEYTARIIHAGRRIEFRVLGDINIHMDDQAWWPKVFDDMQAEIAAAGGLGNTP